MSRLRTVLAGLALTLGALLHAGAGAAPHEQALAAAHAVPAEQADPTDPADPAAHQVLVMLRLPPKHYRPDGAYGGGYMSDTGSAARRRLAGELAAAHGLRLRDSWPMPAIGVDCFVMEEPSGAPLGRVLAALARDARVAWAQPLAQYQGMASADPLYPIQPAALDWHLAELHRVSTGRRVLVAVVDSGVDANHPDLAGQFQVRRNFVDDGPDVAEAHGTAVAGIIGARANNGVGIAGVAPGARLMALRACWETGGQGARCNTLSLAKAINFALENGARIINLSLAGPPDRLLQSLLDAALARGIVVIGAADPQRADGGFPASHPGVIAVARTGERHRPQAGIAYAPGTDIPTCVPGTGWGMVSGSSFAAAHVAGLAALITELRPRAPVAALRRELASASGTPGQAISAATANIDACATLARVANACVCLCSPTTVSKNSLSP
ncbi:S8 family peptidase [Massilia sp. DWR3-1-1]|uniref:S8 family peptidase n=1 Tax=Massilia sp. DWR3-1-1 TaxID=2804559 RepID=UPI003CF1785B